MDGYSQTMGIRESMKKFLLLSLIISLIFILFVAFAVLGGKKYLASLSGIITAFVTINPLEVSISAPAEVEINKIFKIEARVINKGEEKIENARGEIYLPEGLILLRKDPVQEIGVIPGKKEKKISWSVKGEEIGNYVISVKASGELRGQFIEAEDSTTVKIKLFLKGKNLWQWLQDFLDFLR